MADTETVVIGAGVVGLAIAARLAPHSPDLVILERNPKPGQETSSRNSEVIHGGMYYPTGSLKARLCVLGNTRMYEVCERHRVPHARIGKIITAVEESELPVLDRLLALGTANGVELHRLSAAECQALEPHVRSEGALLSPNTGIVSAHGLMDFYLQAARGHGAVLQAHSEVVGLERRTTDWEIRVRQADRVESFTAERVVNAAGLRSDAIARLAGIDIDAAGYRLHLCKGSYFSVSAAKSRLVSRLVYPVPSQVSLGVHALRDLAGRMRFGPDAEYVTGELLDYRVDESKKAEFGASVRRLVPELEDADLEADISGVRPKLQGPGDPFRDFVIVDESAHNLPGLFNLVGIDSPGLTAAPAIADYVAGLMGVSH